MKWVRTWWQGLSDLVRLRIVALAALAGVAIVPSLIALLAGESFSGLLLNFGTEMAGAFVTFIVFDQLIASREKHEEQERLKRSLIAQLGSQINEVAVAAAEELRRREWTGDGALQRAHLVEARS